MAKLPDAWVFKPNSFPAAVRFAALLFSTFALAYGVAELAVGHTYVPGKRAGMILTGGPTLMIALAWLLFCVSSVLVVVDHYDTRDNEALYKRTRAWMVRAGAVLLVSAPMLEIALIFVRVDGTAGPALYRGFVADVPMHAPGLAMSVGRIADQLLHGLVGYLFLATVGLFALIVLAEKLKARVVNEVKAGVGLAMLGSLSVLMLCEAARQFATGQVKVHRHLVLALEHPAEFNAVLVTKAFGGVFMLLMCVAALATLVRKWMGRDASANV